MGTYYPPPPLFSLSVDECTATPVSPAVRDDVEKGIVPGPIFPPHPVHIVRVLIPKGSHQKNLHS